MTYPTQQQCDFSVAEKRRKIKNNGGEKDCSQIINVLIMQLLPDHRNEVTGLAECERIPNVSRVWHSTTTYVVRLREGL